MRKVLLYGLSLLLSLAACGQPPANQQETREPAPAVSSSQADVSAPEPEKPAGPEQLSNRAEQEEPEELSGEAPARYFQLTYDGSKTYVGGLSTEEAVDWELDVLNIRAQNENQRLPDDYRDQYRAWRPVDEASASTAQQTKPSTQTQPTTPQPSGGKARALAFSPSATTSVPSGPRSSSPSRTIVFARTRSALP